MNKIGLMKNAIGGSTIDAIIKETLHPVVISVLFFATQSKDTTETTIRHCMVIRKQTVRKTFDSETLPSVVISVVFFANQSKETTETSTKRCLVIREQTVRKTFDIDRPTVTKTFDMVKPSSMLQLLTFRVSAMFRFWSFVSCHASNLFVNVLFQNTE